MFDVSGFTDEKEEFSNSKKDVVKFLKIIGVDKNISISILSGILEITTGEIMLSSLALPQNLSIIISTALVSFGGLSIHAQAYSYLQDFDMPYRKFLLQKITHCILATLVSFLLLCIV